VSEPEHKNRMDLFLIAESEEQRSSRVAELRQLVERGSYEVPSPDVAEAMVSYFRREFPDRGDGNPGSAPKSC